MSKETWDYVVVGAGSAGSVVAGRLAQAGARVLVLEAGGSDLKLDVIIPAAVTGAYVKRNWSYPVEADASRGGREEPWPSGKVLGGGGSINSMVFVRGNRADFDGWAKLGCPGWDYESVLPSFQRMETWERGSDSFRGGDGPISVVEQGYHHPGNDAFLVAGKQAGHERTFDYNGARQEGVGVSQTNMRRGTRSQASREYLRGLAPKHLLDVKTHAQASRILFEKDRAVGVEYSHNGQVHQAYAREEVIVSSGVVGSPKLLMLSGIGQKAELEAKGIEVLANSPGVGENVQDHSNAFLRWRSLVPTVNDPRLRVKVKAAREFVQHGRGAIAMTYYHVLIFTRTNTSLDAPNYQIGFSPFAIAHTTSEDGQLTVEPDQQQGLMVTCALVKPQYRGKISLRSANPDDMPVIHYEYFANEDDLTEMAAGVAEANRIMGQPAMKDLIAEPYTPERNNKTDADWKQWLRDTASFGTHGVGSCKMGSDGLAVVDPELNVHGVQGLRVVDASIMPTVTTGNTNAPSMMIGEHAAKFILGNR